MDDHNIIDDDHDDGNVDGGSSLEHHHQNDHRRWSSSSLLAIKNKLLMIPGPTNIHPRVLKALSTPILSHNDPQWYQLLVQIQDGIRFLFQTQNPYTFALTGSATLAMETCVHNLLEPGQILLCLANGYWESRISSMARRLGAIAHMLTGGASLGQGPTLMEIQRALKMYRPRLLYVCHGDSSLGSVQCLNGIGTACHQAGCLLLVDAVVSLCSTPLAMDQMQIDVLYSGCQKALSGPPGVALISFSKRAMQTIQARSKPITSFYMDIGLIAKAWGIHGYDDGEPTTTHPHHHQYHYTPAINLLYALQACIQEIHREGLPQVIQRHQQAKSYLEQRLLEQQPELKLELLVKNPRNRLAGITSVLIPVGIQGPEVVRYLYEKHDILIAGSLMDSNKDLPKFWRIGYLGVNADPSKIDMVVQGLKEAILEQKRRRLKPHL